MFLMLVYILDGHLKMAFIKKLKLLNETGVVL